MTTTETIYRVYREIPNHLPVEWQDMGVKTLDDLRWIAAARFNNQEWYGRDVRIVKDGVEIDLTQELMDHPEA